MATRRCNKPEVKCVDTKGRRRQNQFKGIHLLPTTYSSDVQNYIQDVMSKYKVKKSYFKFQCFLCKTSLQSYFEFLKHIEESSHVTNVVETGSQCTMICVLCGYVLIAVEYKEIHDHLDLHKSLPTKRDQRLCTTNFSASTVHIPVVSSDHPLDEIIYQNYSRKVTLEKGYVEEIKKKKPNPDNGYLDPILEKSLNLITDRAKVNLHSLIGVKENQTTDSSCPKVLLLDQKIVTPNNNIEQNKKKEIKAFLPKSAKFSLSFFVCLNHNMIDEYIIADFSISNIEKYITETYYAVYYPLRELYFSCLSCQIKNKNKKSFFSHIEGRWHQKNMEKNSDIEYYIKLCDICQIFFFGTIEEIKKHFGNCNHRKCLTWNMDVIKKNYSFSSGVLNLGWSGELTSACSDIFSSESLLNLWVESALKEAAYEESKNCSLEIVLKQDIKKALGKELMEGIDFKIEFHGSRRYGLAKKCNDVDIYIERLKNWNTISELEKLFSDCNDLFEVNETISNARVPIIRLKHITTNLKCDINCSNSTGIYVSDLIKVYLSLDSRIKWLTMAIREWGEANNLRGPKKFSTYGLTWLLFFFLMSPNIGLVPPANLLLEMYEGDRIFIDGWNFSFTRDIEAIRNLHNPSSNPLNKFELLSKFFHYYASLSCRSLVLSTYDGKAYERRFVRYGHQLYSTLNNCRNIKLSNDIPLILIDPLRLDHNPLLSVDQNLFDHFKLLCKKTLACGWCNSI